MQITDIRIETTGATASHKTIVAGLRAYNQPHLGTRRREKKVVLTARNEANDIIGGIVGYFSFDWLYVHLLWVDEAHRGKDVGSALIAAAEREARKRGAITIRLETWSFQAPGFYTKLGFREFGRLDDHPQGHTTFFFVKSLT